MMIPGSWHSKVSFDISFVAQQIELRQKAVKKIASFIKPRTILLPKLYEQSTNEVVAVFKATLIRGVSLLDATAGLGMDAFCIGRNFSSVTCLEPNPLHSGILKHNLGLLDFNPEILNESLEAFLTRGNSVYDVIYIDPDRRPGAQRQLFELEACSPNVIDLKNRLLQRAGEVWIKLSPMVSIDELIRQFDGNIERVISIAHLNEMKEVLVCLKTSPAELSHTAVNIKQGNVSSFTSGSISDSPVLSIPQRYFFEPSVALIKSRLASSYALREGLLALYPRGNYFTLEENKQDLDGRLFEVNTTMAYKADGLRDFCRVNGIQKANISCRNFFWKPEEVKRQLKIKDGGDWYLFCYCDGDKKPLALWCRKTGLK
jgi:16S rRNA G966 N2-methylase RsmD